MDAGDACPVIAQNSGCDHHSATVLLRGGDRPPRLESARGDNGFDPNRRLVFRAKGCSLRTAWPPRRFSFSAGTRTNCFPPGFSCPSQWLGQLCCSAIHSSGFSSVAALRTLSCHKRWCAARVVGCTPVMNGFRVEYLYRWQRGLVRCRSSFGTFTWLRQFL